MLNKILNISFFITISISAHCQALFPVKDSKTKLFGYQSGSNLNWKIMPQYETAEEFINDKAIVSINGLFGLINKNGSFVLRPKFEKLEGEKYFTFKLKDTLGILDSSGKILLAGSFTHLFYEPSLGTAMILGNELYGYWDTLGNFIPPVSKYELVFENGIAYFNSGKSQGFIHKNGKKIVEVEEGKIWAINSLGYISNKENKECVYDINGTSIGECSFDEIIQMRKDIILFLKDKKYGIMDYSGKNISFNDYDYISPFNNKGISVVKKNALFGLINEKNEFVLPLDKQQIGEYGKGYKRFYGQYDTTFNHSVYKQNDLFGVLNDSGKVIIEAKYDMAMLEGEYLLKYIFQDSLCLQDIRKLKRLPLIVSYNFVNNRAAFCIENNGLNCGVTDPQGNILVKPAFKNITSNFNGNCIVKNNNGTGIIDSTAQIITPLVYSEIKTLNDLLIDNYGSSGDFAWDGYYYLKTKNNKVGVVTDSGKAIVDTAYSMISSYDADGKCWFAKTKKGWRIISKKGKKYRIKLDTLSIFKEGVAVAKKKNKFGLINNKGEAIIPFKYDELDRLTDDVYFFKIDSSWGLIKKDKTILSAARFKIKTPIISGYAFVKEKNHWGVLDTCGNFYPGFEKLKSSDSSGNFSQQKLVSFSFANIPGYDEISMELFQSHPNQEIMTKMNEKVLNALEKFFLISENSFKGALTFPFIKRNMDQKVNYNGVGIEFASSSKTTISISYFHEEYNRKEKINASDDAFEVYSIEGNNLTQLSLSNLFNSESYLNILNGLAKAETFQLGLPPSESFPLDTLIFDTKKFMLFDEGLVLQLNPKAFEEGFDFNKKFGVVIPYDKIRDIIKADGPLKEFYE